jgi:hypothetical protein
MDILFRFGYHMGRVILHTKPDPEKLELERAKQFFLLPLEEKLNRLFALIDLSVKLNNNKPIKQPQGKGLIIRKPL